MPPNPPVDPALEERVARALYEARTYGGYPKPGWDSNVPGHSEYDREQKRIAARAALAALTTEDLKALLQARSDEVVVSSERRQARFKELTVHHTATAAGPAEEVIDQIRRYHVEERGWDDIAYHLLIDAEGGLWLGRDLDRAPDSHSDVDFTGHLFVALLGNFEEHEPTAEQLRSLGALIALTGLPVGLHRDHADTLCPGRHLTAHLRSKLSQAVEAGVVYRCPHDGMPPSDGPDRTLPCGFNHSGGGFYHLQPGKTMDDYDAVFEEPA